ncbi:hypothetical protein CCYN49044_40046 [Capnocytophaga cynodegmi]|uniref:Uncharacterized protein n=1 Tax=Capnocytophaga cynodegmi TaxID=28189 RepID=A0A0B7HNC0_9FLAO|nr:hypothetical protein CCYN74_210065 [Capnocytophaga cynodegmi]CEN40770.1 hypothetical protein CCYN49044_40046 [Capnocytophaga cynodegmi]
MPLVVTFSLSYCSNFELFALNLISETKLLLFNGIIKSKKVNKFQQKLIKINILIAEKLNHNKSSHLFNT